MKQGEELDAVCIDDAGFATAGDHQDVRVWHTPDGDGVGLYYVPATPTLPAASTFAEFQSSYARMTEQSGAKLVDLTIGLFQGCRVLRAVVKVPQSPTGMTYVGSLTSPFLTCSYVLKVQCEERGTTGIREAILMDEALQEGTVSLGDGGISGDWDPDSVRYDERFPDHPLSRARRHLSIIEENLRFRDGIGNGEPCFPLPS